MAQNTEAIVRDFYKTINSHDAARALECLSDGFEFKDVSFDQTYRGKSGFREMMQAWLRGLPDLQLVVKNLVAKGDTCVAEIAVRGTHKGPLQTPDGEIAPTGKSVEAPSCDVITLRDGKIESVHCYFAAPVLLKQIGVAPPVRAAA